MVRCLPLVAIGVAIGCGGPKRAGLGQSCYMAQCASGLHCDNGTCVEGAIDAGLPAIDGWWDAPPDAPAVTCDVLAQTGCAAAEKCTWRQDGVNLGYVACAPDGTVAAGSACTWRPYGQGGYDDCTHGNVCADDGGGSACEPICDPLRGSSACASGRTCWLYKGTFGQGVERPTLGACDPICDPLADNDLLGTGSRPGSACGSGQGCYDSPGTVASHRFVCMRELNPALVHRTACTIANGCSAFGLFDACAQGYAPLVADSTGSSQTDCVAYCTPGNAYFGNPGPQAPAGQAPHICATTDARGAFGVTATATTNGEHCMYSWTLELDGANQLVRTPTSDTVGYCVDHTKYVDANNVTWPPCASLPLTAAPGQPVAADYGCVDSHLAGFPGRAPSLRRP
jgi:hypothetical protein